MAKYGININEIKELENIEDDNEGQINKKECAIQVKLFELINGEYLLRFLKISGELEDYYKNVEKIINKIKEF